MKHIKSFFAAFLLFILSAVVLHFISSDSICVNNRAFSLWISEQKAGSFQGITGNQNEHNIPVFGSSEFQHAADTIYHPRQVFAETDFYPMTIGAGYYQSLGHAITLAAIAPHMKNQKAVLILSPQWFRKTGVVDQAFISRFSELMYIEMLQNNQLSKDTKDYIVKRTKKLLKSDDKMRQRVKMYQKVIYDGNAGIMDKFQTEVWRKFLLEKDRIMTWAGITAEGIASSDLPEEGTQTPDWDNLMEKAQEDGEKENTNPFYINDEIYHVLESVLDKKKDMNKDALKGYQTGPEFEDLECFMNVCRELEIEPLLVILPVNGYYYDHTGFPQSARDAYYQKIKDLAEQHDVTYADFLIRNIQSISLKIEYILEKKDGCW